MTAATPSRTQPIRAQEYARSLLHPPGRRWRHTEAVAGVARWLAQYLPWSEGGTLVEAAYLHDIGYSPSSHIPGSILSTVPATYSPSGTLGWLPSSLTTPEPRYEATVRGHEHDLEAFDDEASAVSSALASCDLTTRPDGQPMTPQQRLLDVGSRYGEDSPVTNGLHAAWPELTDTVAQIEALHGGPRVSESDPRPLP